MSAWIGIAGTFVTMLVIFAGVVSRFSKMELKVENTQQQLDKHEQKTEKNINELFNSRNETDKNIVELTTTIKLLVSSIETQNKTAETHFAAIDKKLEEINIEIKTRTGAIK